jgi:hypothetical protein
MRKKVVEVATSTTFKTLIINILKSKDEPSTPKIKKPLAVHLSDY